MCPPSNRQSYSMRQDASIVLWAVINYITKTFLLVTEVQTRSSAGARGRAGNLERGTYSYLSTFLISKSFTVYTTSLPPLVITTSGILLNHTANSRQATPVLVQQLTTFSHLFTSMKMPFHKPDLI